MSECEAQSSQAVLNRDRLHILDNCPHRSQGAVRLEPDLCQCLPPFRHDAPFQRPLISLPFPHESPQRQQHAPPADRQATRRARRQTASVRGPDWDGRANVIASPVSWRTAEASRGGLTRPPNAGIAAYPDCRSARCLRYERANRQRPRKHHARCGHSFVQSRRPISPSVTDAGWACLRATSNPQAPRPGPRIGR